MNNQAFGGERKRIPLMSRKLTENRGLQKWRFRQKMCTNGPVCAGFTHSEPAQTGGYVQKMTL